MIPNQTLVILKIFVLVTFIFFNNPQGFSQTSNEVDKTYSDILTAIGKDQVLTNGIFFENTTRNDLGHPYFQKDEYEDGYIVLRDKKYDNLLVKYDIFNQKVIVINPKQIPQFAFLPPTDFIPEFGLNNYCFRKDPLIDSASVYCQVVYDGNFKCYYVHQKKRTESYHNVKYSAFKYSEGKSIRYLINNNTVFTYKSNGSFLKIFNPEDSKQIKAYLKKDRIKVNKADDRIIRELMAYCEQFSNSKNSSDE